MGTNRSASGIRAVGVSGSPDRLRSRSRQLLDIALVSLADRGAEVRTIDLAALDAPALVGRTRDAEVDAALALVVSADVVVVATPIYRATYSGLLKVFFDLLPNAALVDTVALPIATGGSPGHQLAIDHGLRPLLASLGAVVVPTGVYAATESFGDGVPDRALLDRLQRAVDETIRIARGLPGRHDTLDAISTIAAPLRLTAAER